jgi:hypothetical protein
VNVDDAGRRAGTALRDRFDRLTAPPLAETAPRRSRSGRPAMLAGVAAALVIALLVAVVAPWRESGGPAEPGGTWKRIDQRTAFGRHASPTVITTWRGRLLALGSQQVSKDPLRLQPAAWTSDDGERWGRVQLVETPREFWGFTSVAVRGETIVASLDLHGQMWRSDDARTWRRVVDAQFHRGTTYYVQSTNDRFVAADVGPLGGGRTLSSGDGLRWTKRDGSTSGAHPVGIGVGAPLQGGWINVGGARTQDVAPFVYGSPNAVRWTRIDGARAPVRMSSPLAANHARNRVLGIQYDDFPEYGGRLWSTRDGSRWTEIRSFHEQMPVGNPDHLVQVGHWWVLGGNSGVPSTAPQGERRATMWTSPDLRRWYEMPARLRGPKTAGVGMPLVEHDGRVIGRGSGLLWIWSPPG